MYIGRELGILYPLSGKSHDHSGHTFSLQYHGSVVGIPFSDFDDCQKAVFS
jgi:hypothetical protein